MGENLVLDMGGMASRWRFQSHRRKSGQISGWAWQGQKYHRHSLIPEFIAR